MIYEVPFRNEPMVGGKHLLYSETILLYYLINIFCVDEVYVGFQLQEVSGK